MTQFLIDIASWQTTEKRPSDPLDLAKAKAAGFSLVNIKVGQGDWYSYRSWMGDYAARAWQLGMGVCTFHWLDNTASGAAQAQIAFDRMKRIGGGSADGMAHQCDCEDTTGKPATFAIWRDYVNAMQDKLGRPIVNYTGDWWWEPKGWTGAGLTPYLWAAPNSGYLSGYPGDTSSKWHAGYGGWGDYAVLQYAVSPIAGAGGGNLSKSAIRDPRVWAALTGQPEEDEMTPDELMKADVVPWDDTKNYTVGGALYDTAGRTAELLRQVAAVRAGQEAILGAVKGLDTKAVLARINEVATAEAQRDAELPARLLAALPAGSDPVSREELEAALRSVLGSVDNPPAT